jgi:hypothetical protein
MTPQLPPDLLRTSVDASESADGAFGGADSLSEELLTSIWDRIHSSGQMVESFPAPSDADVMLMATAFGDFSENALYVQPLDGETLFDESQQRQFVYVRRRASNDSAWGRWEARTTESGSLL